MTYNEFVCRPTTIWRRVLHKRDEVSQLESICLVANIQLTERVQASIENTREKNLVAYAQAKRELDNLIIDLLKSQSEVRTFLYDVLEPNEADILEWKYVNGKSAGEISEIIGLEEQSVRNKLSRLDKKAQHLYIGYKIV